MELFYATLQRGKPPSGRCLRLLHPFELLLQLLLEGVIHVLIIPTSVIPVLFPLLRFLASILGCLPIWLLEFLELVLLVEAPSLLLLRHSVLPVRTLCCGALERRARL